MKKLLPLIFCILLLLPGITLATVPQEIKDGVDDALGQSDVGSWESFFHTLPEDSKALWGDGSLSDMIGSYALSEQDYQGEFLLDSIFAMLKNALPEMLPLIISLLAIALLSGFLRAMSDAGMRGLNDLVGFVCQCFAIAIAMGSFLSLAVLARETIARTSTFIEMAFPVLLTLLTAAGGIASAGIFQPAMAMLSSGMSVALQGVVLPVILAGGALGIINNITDRVQLSQLYQLSKTVAKWMIGLLTTLYLGITSLQGLTAGAFDGISIRTAKFAVDKFIPIVGGMVSGTVDTVLGCAMLVKNATGIVAMLITFSIVISPLLRIAAGMLAFRLAAALCEPIGEPRLPKMLASLGDVLTYLFAATISLSLMFMITVGLVIGMGNAAMMGG